jgi:gas vesicle protein
MSDPVRENYQELAEQILDYVKAPAKDKVTEILNQVADRAVAETDTQAAQMARLVASMKQIKIQFGLLGVACGAAAGAVTGFYIAYRKAEMKYSKIADDEIASMREHYQEKSRALEAQAAKRPVEDIVRERGYASSDTKTDGPPMAVPPPAAVTESGGDEDNEADSKTEEDDSKEVKTPPPEPTLFQNIFREVPEVEHEWNYHEERKRRSPDIPYVIHYDERFEMETYQEVTLTYYELDDVLCDDRDSVIDPDRRDNLIGDGNLNRFGHGSNDPSIVYVRNDTLELVYEVVKSPNSYAEEVHGFSHEAWDRGNLERMRARERDEPEEN